MTILALSSALCSAYEVEKLESCDVPMGVTLAYTALNTRDDINVLQGWNHIDKAQSEFSGLTARSDAYDISRAQYKAS